MKKAIYTVIVSCLVVVIIIAIPILYFRASSNRISLKTHSALCSNYLKAESLKNSTIKQISNPKEALMHAEIYYKAELMHLLTLTENQFFQLIFTTYLASQCDPWMILAAVKDSIATTITPEQDKIIIKEIKSYQLEQIKALTTTDMKTQNTLWRESSILLFVDKIKSLDPNTTVDKTITPRMKEFRDDCTRRYQTTLPLIFKRPKGYTSLTFVDIAFINIHKLILKVMQIKVPNIKFK